MGQVMVAERRPVAARRRHGFLGAAAEGWHLSWGLQRRELSAGPRGGHGEFSLGTRNPMTSTAPLFMGRFAM